MITRRFFIILCMLAGLAADGHAQTVPARKPVAEAQVVKLIPVLRTVAAQVRQSNTPIAPQVKPEETRAAWLALLEDIKTGKIDPLEWIEAHSERVAYPTLADYSEACSRLATELSMRPCAVFGFGMDASEIGLAKLAGDRESERKLVERGLDGSAAQERVNATVESVRRFYQGRKVAGFDRESAFAWSAQSPDSLLTITIMEANVYRAWGNGALPSGPILEIAWNETPDAGPAGDPFSEDLPALLERAKVDARDFLSLVTTLVTARRDARDPSRLKFDENYTPQSSDDKRFFEELKQIITARAEDAKLYRRYARTLDPLLDVFDEPEK